MSLPKKNHIFHLHRNEVFSPGNSSVPSIYSVENKRNFQISQLRELTRFKNIRSWLVENLKNYCSTTSLHGVNHITNPSNTKLERYFWIAVIIISIISSIVLVTFSYLWSRQTPTVTIIESSHFATWNTPFPAVTICNFNKISKEKATALIKTLKRPENVTNAVMEQFFRSTMVFNTPSNFSETDINLYESILEMNNLTLPSLTDLLSPECLDMISRCLWKGTSTRCDSLFQRIISIHGICCSFNYFGRATNNFPAKIAYQISKRPYRVTGCGYPTGLSVLLNPNAADYFGTYFSSHGFRLLVHDAYDFPDENAETKAITSTRETFIRINPESTYATPDIRNMELAMRNCYFSNEHPLETMQRYSFINCMIECRIAMLYERCGCVPTHLQGNGSLPLCSFRQLNCVIRYREIFTRALPNISANSIPVVTETQKFPCNCLPDCESNNYPSEITNGRLNVKLSFNRVTENESRQNRDDILLHVFFSDLMSTRYRMELFQNWLSALASFGGLLGLIMGFSIVTAFEFIYYLTFRPAFNHFNNYDD